MTFGQRVMAARKAKKMSQGELGDLVGTSGPVVGKWERGEMQPSIETAIKISKALDVSLDHLVGLAEDLDVSKELLERAAEIDKMPPDEREKVLYFIDMAISDYKNRELYKGREL